MNYLNPFIFLKHPWDDGGKTTYGNLLLHTNSYTLEEVELLVSVLNNNFNLVCKVSQRRPNQWAILIPKRELHKVRALVSYLYSLFNGI